MRIAGKSRLPWQLAVLCTVLGFCIASCNDDSADMARQIAQSAPRKGSAGGGTGGGAARPEQVPAGGRGKAGQAPDSTKAQGVPGRLGLAGATAAPGEGDSDAVAPEGPKVEVRLLDVKAPYPRFSGAGYYDFDIEVTALESVPASVWRIVVEDAEQNEVGSDQQVLVLTLDRPKRFSFKKFYCERLPVGVKLELTEKQAEGVPEDGSDKQQGSKAPGIGTGGQKQGGGGGGSSPGGDGEGDDGSGEDAIGGDE